MSKESRCFRFWTGLVTEVVFWKEWRLPSRRRNAAIFSIFIRLQAICGISFGQREFAFGSEFSNVFGRETPTTIESVAALSHIDVALPPM